MSQLGGIGEEGRSKGEREGGEADKRDQLLFAHKPQVDNEWRGWGGAGQCLGRSLCQLKSLPESLCPSASPRSGPSLLTPTHTSAPRTAAGEGRKGPVP